MNPYKVKHAITKLTIGTLYAGATVTISFVGLTQFMLPQPSNDVGLANQSVKPTTVKMAATYEHQRPDSAQQNSPTPVDDADTSWTPQEFNLTSIGGGNLFGNTAPYAKAALAQLVPFGNYAAKQVINFPDVGDSDSLYVPTSNDFGATCPKIRGLHYKKLLNNKEVLQQVYDTALAKTGSAEQALFYAGVVGTESHGNPKARSKAGAEGACQFMPSTARMYNLKDPYDVEQCVPAMIQYYEDLMNIDHITNISEAAAGYNAGPGSQRKQNGMLRWYGKNTDKRAGRENTCYPVTIRKVMVMLENGILQTAGGTTITPESLALRQVALNGSDVHGSN